MAKRTQPDETKISYITSSHEEANWLPCPDADDCAFPGALPLGVARRPQLVRLEATRAQLSSAADGQESRVETRS